MTDDPVFRTDLYRGAAAYYDEFRLPYPDALLDDLCARTSVAGGSRLLDVACGPGTIALALHDRFADVLGVDQEPEFVEFAASKAAAIGARNTRWSTARAEELEADGTFDLVTIGNAFHRLQRARVAERALTWLRPGGHLALLWASLPMSGPTAWERALVDVVFGWSERVDARERVPATFEAHMAGRPHLDVVRDAGFDVVGRNEYVQRHDWTLRELVGLVYSTSILPRPVLGDRAGAFETDLRERLLAIEPGGVFREDVSFAYDLARRR